MPTGGVSAGNLGDFLALPAVLACGGSWLTPKDAIAEGNYQEGDRPCGRGSRCRTRGEGDKTMGKFVNVWRNHVAAQISGS